MTNNTVLVGRITKDLELKSIQRGNGDAVSCTTFTLAVNRPFANQNGEKEADFIRCTVWRKPAENLVKYMGKGSLISVVGRIQTSSKEIQGKKEYFVEVLCGEITYLESAKKNESQNNQQQGGYQNTQQQGGYQNNQQQGGYQNNQQQGGYQNNQQQGGYQNAQQQGGYQNNQQQGGYQNNQQQGGHSQVLTPSYADVTDDDLPF